MNSDSGRLLKQGIAARYVPAIAIAWLELGLGNLDISIDWLMVACREGEPYLASARVSPAYDPIRQHPRFQEFACELEMSSKRCGPIGGA